MQLNFGLFLCFSTIFAVILLADITNADENLGQEEQEYVRPAPKEQ